MTTDDLFYITEVGKHCSFKYNGKEYNLSYDKDASGNKIYIFGPLEDLQHYVSFGELINCAMVENHFFREMLEDLNL